MVWMGKIWCGWMVKVQGLFWSEVVVFVVVYWVMLFRMIVLFCLVILVVLIGGFENIFVVVRFFGFWQILVVGLDWIMWLFDIRVVWLFSSKVFLGFEVVQIIIVLWLVNSLGSWFWSFLCSLQLRFVSGLFRNIVLFFLMMVWVSVVCCCWLLDSLCGLCLRYGFSFIRFVVFVILLVIFDLVILVILRGEVILLKIFICGQFMKNWCMRLMLCFCVFRFDMFCLLRMILLDVSGLRFVISLIRDVLLVFVLFRRILK